MFLVDRTFGGMGAGSHHQQAGEEVNVAS